MVYSLKTGKTTTMKDCSLIYSTKFSFCHVLPHDDIDDFFECVQVNSENDIVRRNRLNLLGQIRATCNLVADLSKIEGQSG